jgi:4-hydroxythreonine-4-phosphate dehydrogenase
MMNPSENESNKIKVGITHGDFNGIGYEVIMKTLQDVRLLEMFTPVIYGSSKIASYYRKIFDLPEMNFNLIKKAEYANPKRLNIINCYENEVKIEIGKPTAIAGELAYYALEKALEDLSHQKIDALVTAPISKYNIQSDKFSFKGHTEYLASKFGTKDFLMLMVGNSLRVGVVTGHIPLKDVPQNITPENILNKMRVMNNSLKMDFGIAKPRIAVLGLNPHAGDEGLIGTEESEIIRPAIQKAFDEGILTFGPFPADGFFGSSNFTQFDAVLAMYHDQGMIPFKSIMFEQGVNFTAGLPIVRTSPAHGTAFDIAGKNEASSDSFRQAIYTAIDICKNRESYKILNKDPLPFKQPAQKPVFDSAVDELNATSLEKKNDAIL